MKAWYVIESDEEYDIAFARYNEIKYAHKWTDEHKEKMLLTVLITDYEEKVFEHPIIHPIDMIKSRMDDLNITEEDLSTSCSCSVELINSVLSYKSYMAIDLIDKIARLIGVHYSCLCETYELEK